MILPTIAFQYKDFVLQKATSNKHVFSIIVTFSDSFSVSLSIESKVAWGTSENTFKNTKTHAIIVIKTTSCSKIHKDTDLKKTKVCFKVYFLSVYNKQNTQLMLVKTLFRI